MDQVSLSPTAASQCMAACDSYIAGLDFFLGSVHKTTNVEAFGTLDSGRALGGKFAGLAVGEPYSLDSVLRQHIEVMTRLKAAFEAAGNRYVETDDQNAANLTVQGPNLVDQPAQSNSVEGIEATMERAWPEWFVQELVEFLQLIDFDWMPDPADPILGVTKMNHGRQQLVCRCAHEVIRHRPIICSELFDAPHASASQQSRRASITR